MMTMTGGYSVDYLINEVGPGRENYYLAGVKQGNEPPGLWRGRAAARLGLEGEVRPADMKLVYEKGVTRDGQPLGRKASDFPGMRAQAEEAIALRIAAEGQVTPERERAIRNLEMSKVHGSVSFFDFTLSVPKSVSVAWIAYRASAAQARDQGRLGEAARLQDKAAGIERAIAYSRDVAIESIEANTYTRTGAGGCEWRKATGVIAATFQQHTSREGDPQLHVHMAVRNAVQRADGADTKWRTADSRHWTEARLGIAADQVSALMDALHAEGFVLTGRADGNEFEIKGVPQEAMDFFSARRATITPQIARLAATFEARYDRPPTQFELWDMRQRATLMTRPSKTGTAPSAEEELDGWVAGISEGAWPGAYRRHREGRGQFRYRRRVRREGAGLLYRVRDRRGAVPQSYLD